MDETALNVNLILNINERGKLEEVSTVKDAEIPKNKFINQKSSFYGNFCCVDCQANYRIRIFFKFPFELDTRENEDGVVITYEGLALENIVKVEEVHGECEEETVLETIKSEVEDVSKELASEPEKELEIKKTTNKPGIKTKKIKSKKNKKTVALGNQENCGSIQQVGNKKRRKEKQTEEEKESFDERILKKRKTEEEKYESRKVKQTTPNYELLQDLALKVEDCDVDLFEGYYDSSEDTDNEVLSEPWWDPTIKVTTGIHKDVGVICEECGGKYKTELLLLKHIRKTHSENQHVCHLCGKKYTNIASLRTHRYYHRNPRKTPELRRTQQCEKCGKEIRDREALRNHLLLVHNIADGKMYQCSECPFKTMQKRRLNEHFINIHAAEKKKYVCACGKSFLRYETLTKHLSAVHEGKRPFQCDSCGKAYKTKGELNTHMNLHTGKTPFECRFCDKKFQDRGNKNAHQRKVHTAEYEEFKREFNVQQKGKAKEKL